RRVCCRQLLSQCLNLQLHCFQCTLLRSPLFSFFIYTGNPLLETSSARVSAVSTAFGFGAMTCNASTCCTFVCFSSISFTITTVVSHRRGGEPRVRLGLPMSHGCVSVRSAGAYAQPANGDINRGVNSAM